jgi:phosphoserine phosphatase
MHPWPLPIPCTRTKNQDIIFDMDGTLLQGDLGETFFFARLLHKSNHLSLDPSTWDYQSGQTFELNKTSSDTLAAYIDLWERGEDTASFLEAYKIVAGTSPEEMRAFTTAVLDAQVPIVSLHFQLRSENHTCTRTVRFGARLRPFMERLTAMLHSCGARLWIISATTQYLCEGLGDRLSIPRDQVRAVLVSEDPLKVIRFPWRESKADTLREAGIVSPLMVFGDTMGDADMLDQAQYPIVMADSEPDLLKLAAQNHWYILDPAGRDT